MMTSCECGEDEYGRSLSGGCEYCKERERQDQINTHNYFLRDVQIKGFANKLLREWRPEMMDALTTAISHSKNNEVAYTALQNLKELLDPVIKFKADKEYEWHYDFNKKMNEGWGVLNERLNSK